jgi:hypothetical protein
MNFIKDIRALLIALWLGAACFFSFAVAPSAFGVLASRELAGSMVSRTLMIVNLSGLVIGLILLVSSFVKQTGTKPVLIWLERLLLAILVGACAVGQFVIGIWLSYVKSQMGRPIDEVPLEDPLRIQFNNLHEYSVWILVTAMIAALAAFFIIARKSEKAPPVTNTTGLPDFKF